MGLETIKRQTILCIAVWLQVKARERGLIGSSPPLVCDTKASLQLQLPLVALYSLSVTRLCICIPFLPLPTRSYSAVFLLNSNRIPNWLALILGEESG